MEEITGSSKERDSESDKEWDYSVETDEDSANDSEKDSKSSIDVDDDQYDTAEETFEEYIRENLKGNQLTANNKKKILSTTFSNDEQNSKITFVSEEKKISLKKDFIVSGNRLNCDDYPNFELIYDRGSRVTLEANEKMSEKDLRDIPDGDKLTTIARNTNLTTVFSNGKQNSRLTVTSCKKGQLTLKDESFLSENKACPGNGPDFEIIYDRASKVHSKTNWPASTSRKETYNNCAATEGTDQKCMYNKLKNDHKGRRKLNKTDNYVQIYNPVGINNLDVKSLHRPHFTSDASEQFTQADNCIWLSADITKTEDVNQRDFEINYRDSQTLLKTYMIKMLFLAMKTAYPDPESWKPDQLSSLLKMALCMIYYAYSSEEKGILNFWFQDLIENRTRESTCKEILYSLDRLVHVLERTIQDHDTVVEK